MTSDLGLQIVWRVDDAGRYDALWEVPLSARRGVYRIVVLANRYRLASRRFNVVASNRLHLRRVSAGAGRVGVTLDYPPAIYQRDFTWRPPDATGGAVRFTVGSRSVLVRRRRGTVFSVAAPSGVPVTIAGGHARDRYGNVAGAGLRLQG